MKISKKIFVDPITDLIKDLPYVFMLVILVLSTLMKIFSLVMILFSIVFVFTESNMFGLIMLPLSYISFCLFSFFSKWADRQLTYNL